MDFSILLMPVFVGLSWLVVVEIYRPRGVVTGRCRCGYDLCGLGAEARCPECGSVEREFTRLPRRLRINRERFRPWVWCVASLIALLALGNLIATECLVVSYTRDGFSASLARANIPVRELKGEFAFVGLLWPVFVWAAFSPVVCAVPAKERAWVGRASFAGAMGWAIWIAAHA